MREPYYGIYTKHKPKKYVTLASFDEEGCIHCYSWEEIDLLVYELHKGAEQVFGEPL